MALSTDPKWADVQRVPQDDGPDPVVPIHYSAEFTEAMDYFRALLAKDEKTERALALTERVIELNAANYTVWGFRRAIISALGLDWAKELEWVTELAGDNPKNYQIWHHRRCCIEALGGKTEEIAFLNDFLTDEELDDGKNYHAWAHRQWFVKEYGKWEGELEFCDQLLEEDIRNNSAYNHRFFVQRHKTDLSKDVREAEIGWALKLIDIAPSNESPWAYVRGMCGGHKMGSFPNLVEAINMYNERQVTPPHALEFLADLLLEEGGPEKAAEAREQFERLQMDDPIRAKFWAWRAASAK